ncbi:hypothetical protein [Planosporangium mesophilum]|uniref:Uncharacterized protein n=1 Tax=Planosporangium mesophilum TaxID=689768 RepID=A0A8J3X0I1_9ACTN|nr:hypothetical protein [Planosporangium mesophilum]NJC84452.1 hypothetical protein [Planosporangium mesophilum]GII23405.1 hypothetical protein Pme01_30020 [Planosporangium mesophilum]
MTSMSIGSSPSKWSTPRARLGMSYAHDVLRLRHGRIDDGVLRCQRRPGTLTVP